MAVAKREGGLYKVGDTFVDADGKTVSAAEVKKALSGDSGSDEAPKDKFSDMTREELVKAAEKAKLTVTRADGGEGEPLMSDLLRALRA